MKTSKNILTEQEKELVRLSFDGGDKRDRTADLLTFVKAVLCSLYPAEIYFYSCEPFRSTGAKSRS